MPGPISRRQFLTASALAGASLLLPRPALAAAAPAARRYLVCPILMYHYVSEPPEDADPVRRDLTVAPEQFAAQLDYLQSQGFSSVTLAGLAAALLDGADIPDKPVVLTFDDGYADAWTVAAPLLAERGMTGTFFIISGAMEQPGYLTWAQAAEMHAAGLEIGSHSVTHPDLSLLGSAAQQGEIEGAAAAIEAALGARPTTFCYPLGRYNLTTIRLLRQSGHRAAVTTTDGTVQYSRTPYTMRRVRVRGTTTPGAFAWLVSRVAW